MQEDFIHTLGLVGYTARIRRLSDDLASMGKKVYKNLGLEIEPNWHLILLLLKQEKELSATEIAHQLSFSHTAITKIAQKMLAKDYLKSYRSKKDSRKLLYALSAKAIEQLPRLESIWNMIGKIHEQYVRENFLVELEQIERALIEKDTIQRLSDYMELLKETVRVNQEIELKPISIDDSMKLKKLMMDIYPPIYAHLWTDDGQNYLSEIYSKENITRELLNQNSRYFFILFQEQTVGILKYTFGEKHDIGETKTLKLERIYLAKLVQGKGVGSTLFRWLEEEVAAKVDEIWLKAMDTQTDAIQFYKKQGFTIVDKTILQAKNIIPEYKGMFIMSKSRNHE